MMDFGSSDEESSSANEEGDLNLEEERALSDEELFELEFSTHKRDYYINKLKYPEMTE